jgi:SGNH domain (fused to AT3 domains)
VLGLLVATSSASAATPRCYGAASRDPLKPCFNPLLALQVRPTPDAALLTPNAPCNRLQIRDLVRACWFGARKKHGKITVAVVGDSHASAWRAALRPLAIERRWRGISNTHTSCAFSAVVSPGRTKANAKDCRTWNLETLARGKTNTEIDTVFVVDAVIPRPGFKTQMEGYRKAWLALPHTVRHIVVIRDNPRMQADTPPCIDSARHAKRDAGAACARNRSTSLKPDPAVELVHQMHSKRIKAIDLSRYFCDATRCPPVIGGVLVYKDLTHITRAYGATLAPYLLREIKRLKLPL